MYVEVGEVATHTVTDTTAHHFAVHLRHNDALHLHVRIHIGPHQPLHSPLPHRQCLISVYGLILAATVEKPSRS